MQELIRRCSAETGQPPQQVEQTVAAFLNMVTQELSRGNTVDMGKDFGKFIPRLREDKLAENSPRTKAKDPHYKVIFRENSGMRQKLKVKENPNPDEGGRPV